MHPLKFIYEKNLKNIGIAYIVLKGWIIKLYVQYLETKKIKYNCHEYIKLVNIGRLWIKGLFSSVVCFL